MKRFWGATLILTVFLAAFLVLVQIPIRDSAESDSKEALDFLRDVVGLDTAKYQVKLRDHDRITDNWSSVTYDFKRKGNELHVLCNLRNGDPESCRLSVYGGSPLLVRSSVGVLDAAKDIMGRYLEYRGNPKYFRSMRDLLGRVYELKPMNKTEGNIKLKIMMQERGGTVTYIQWDYTFNGVEAHRKGVSFIFIDDRLHSFRDTWGKYTIGCEEVNISKEEAIEIGRECVQNLSYSVGNKTVSNLTLAEEPLLEKLLKEHPSFAELTMQPRGNNVLYPHWELLLPLDQVYPGMTTAVQVMMWADTGEVTHVTPTGGLTTPPEDSTPTE